MAIDAERALTAVSTFIAEDSDCRAARGRGKLQRYG
jgi:hypothetical protein